MPFSCSLNIIDQVDLRRRINEVVKKKTIKGFSEEHSCVNSRIMFEQQSCELFFLPKGSMKRDTLNIHCLNNLALLQMALPWGLVVCCFSPKRAHIAGLKGKELIYTEAKGYPEGVDQATCLSVPFMCASLLFCENGRIVTGSSGKITLQGLELTFLQNKKSNQQAIFCKKKSLDQVSPARPLSLDDNKPFIKIRCYCKSPGFSFSLNIPVLTKEELLDDIHHAGLLRKEGNKRKQGEGITDKCSLFPNAAFSCHVVAFSRGMGLQLPFEGIIGGKICFSSHGIHPSILQLAFIPQPLPPGRSVSDYCARGFATWSTEGSLFSKKYVKVNRASLYSDPSVFISPGPGLERKILGAEMKLVSTVKGGSWGMFVSRKKESSSSVSRTQTTQKGISSPAPGPSGLGSRESTASLAQAAASLSVPLEGQSQHTWAWDRRDFVPGPFGVRHHPYAQGGPQPFDFALYPYPLPGATGPFLSEGQEQQEQQNGKIRPDTPYCPPLASILIDTFVSEASQRRVIRPFPVHDQSASTVSVPFEGQSQQTGPLNRMDFVPGPSGVTHHPYAQGGSEPSGCGLYPYSSGATDPFLSEEQERQAQQSERNRPDMPSYFFPYFPPLASILIDPFAPEASQQRVIRPFPVRAQAVSTVFDPLEGQNQQTGPWNRRGFDVRHHPYGQGGPGPSGFSFYPYSPPEGATGPFLSEGQQQAQQGERNRPFRPYFPPLASAVRPSVMDFDPLAHEAPQQAVEPFPRASVIVSIGAVQQMPIWNPDEKEKEADVTEEVPQQAQEKKSDEGEDVDVEN